MANEIATPVKLSRTQQLKVLESERERAKLERDFIKIVAPTIEAYLRLIQKATLRSLKGTGALTAALESSEIEKEVSELMSLAEENMNPRLLDEPFTQEESVITWFAVLAALISFRSGAVPKQLNDSLQINAIPITTYDVVKRLESKWFDGTIPTIDGLRKEIEITLQLPRKTSSILNREAKGLPLPRGLEDSFAKVFEGTVIEISRSTATNMAADSKIKELRSKNIEWKQWASVWLDDRVRPSHLAAHGQIRRIDETFDVGDSRLLYPGDPNGVPEEVYNCRCVLVEASI